MKRNGFHHWKWIRDILTVLLLSLLSKESLAASDVLVVASLEHYPPYSDHDLKEQGFCPDVTKTALERAGYKVEIRLMDWRKVLESASSGEADVITCSWYVPSRESFLIFTRLLHANRLVFAVSKMDSFEYTRLEDLKGKKVGVVAGYGYPPDFLDAPYIQRVVGPSVEDNIRAVATGGLDATLDDEGLMRSQLRRSLSALAGDIRLTRGAIHETPLVAGVSRHRADAAEIVERFNAALVVMAGDGTLKDLRRRHDLIE
ncbi:MULTISPECIES: substrate-binding periplasmic protein [unclassified Haematospirillum]|uniref:substrate-binding periplasmic protein n=1 Tax=unclassified Haematospirillum TaxID=2622088 RepID=UPI00143A72C3|nr:MULTISPECIES: transporter substrate-binding domain-containing protein [unclassified Haematospirillum]NKD54514.1 transporter substrate-binding domain-containing protein [Haematospirillum sp. H4890]NKD74874.1 transporter substrate-binding domain-containing protein [Haematospirillum sp. H4485]NKD88083.1 transporter substrate-binding domain-containing protein [Haematospirillum sp. 15-248]